jgi:hypothetical protein
VLHSAERLKQENNGRFAELSIVAGRVSFSPSAGGRRSITSLEAGLTYTNLESRLRHRDMLGRSLSSTIVTLVRYVLLTNTTQEIRTDA